jgi:hypothetical protein
LSAIATWSELLFEGVPDLVEFTDVIPVEFTAVALVEFTAVALVEFTGFTILVLLIVFFVALAIVALTGVTTTVAFCGTGAVLVTLGNTTGAGGGGISFGGVNLIWLIFSVAIIGS